MTRTLYFDCFAGISGDMVLGALIDAGVDPKRLVEQIQLLGVEGYEISFEKVDRSGISATRANVKTRAEHHHRHLSDIEKIIFGSSLSEATKKRAAGIFKSLAEAEALVHDVPVEKIHFHEVGGIDAIVDIVGACAGFELLGIEQFLCSALHVGKGTVEMEHGRFPIPPPAVAELLRNAPIYATEIEGELVTPTGAAIVATLCKSFGSLPLMRVSSTGYGAGAREYRKFPNALRILVGASDNARDEVRGAQARGEVVSGDASSERSERLLMIETNVDDCSPQVLGYVLERALALGALDCYLTSVQMKKNRPGVLVSILCRPADRDAMFDLVLTETTSIGARSYEVERRSLGRELVSVDTEYGEIDVKVSRFRGRITTVTPEFDQCREAAQRANVPLRIVEAAARAASEKKQSGVSGQPMADS